MPRYRHIFSVQNTIAYEIPTMQFQLLLFCVKSCLRTYVELKVSQVSVKSYNSDRVQIWAKSVEPFQRYGYFCTEQKKIRLSMNGSKFLFTVVSQVEWGLIRQIHSAEHMLTTLLTIHWWSKKLCVYCVPQKKMCVAYAYADLL